MKVLILVDTSGSMGFQPGDKVELRELDRTGGETPPLAIKEGYILVGTTKAWQLADRTILITDGIIPSIPGKIEVWKIEERR